MAESDGTATPAREILGVRIRDLPQADALAAIHGAIRERRHLKVAFCNAHTANIAFGHAGFREALRHFMVLADGIGVDIAAHWLSGAPFKANLNGTDLIPELLRTADKPLTIALIGARPDVAIKAATVLAKFGPGHTVATIIDGFAEPDAKVAWRDALATNPVDIVLVAMGNPAQELWIDANLDSRHAAVAIGVGALFDFLAGEVSRAPGLVRRMRLEWVWRLMMEPRRLFLRYVLGNPLFLLRVLAGKFGGNQR